MRITFVLKDGTERTCDFEGDQTILQVAEANDVPIHGFCEGFGICGACHIIVENLHDKLPKMSDKESDALDNSNGVTLHSRLACQIKLSDELDGLRVRLL